VLQRRRIRRSALITTVRWTCDDRQEDWQPLIPNLFLESLNRHDKNSAKRCWNGHPQEGMGSSLFWSIANKVSPNETPTRNQVAGWRDGDNDGSSWCQGLVYIIAEICQVLSDRFTVNGYITTGIPLQGYRQATTKERTKDRKGMGLGAKIKAGRGVATTIPPPHLKGKEKYFWKWRLPIGEMNQLLLIRNLLLVIGLDLDGCLCKASKDLTAALKLPHHVGAGGEETASWIDSACFHVLPLSSISTVNQWNWFFKTIFS
jgi:hypothetical protein